MRLPGLAGLRNWRLLPVGRWPRLAQWPQLQVSQLARGWPSTGAREYRRYRYRAPSERYAYYDRYNDPYMDPYDAANKQRERTESEYEEAHRAEQIYARYGRLVYFYIYRRGIAWTLGGVGLVYVTHLERVEASGRWRFMLVPRWLELRMGEQAYAQALAEMRPNLLPESHPKTVLVRKIMDRLIAVTDLRQLDWRVHVVSGPFPPNAFVMPGGKVFVFDSLLPVCQNIDGLATVLSHETAHQVCRHSAESMSKTPINWLVNIAVFMATGIYFSNNPVTSLALELPASREMEREADAVGLNMMARACFHPAEATNLWRRMLKMEQAQGGSVPEFLSTHPASEHRIELIRAHLPEANHIRSENCDNMNKFREAVSW